MAEITSKLKSMRESRGLSQSQLAEKSGVNIRALQYYEQGRLNFDGSKIDKIFAIALALNCDIEDIIEDPKIIKMIRAYQEA